jgi:hypothetical protein
MKPNEKYQFLQVLSSEKKSAQKKLDFEESDFFPPWSPYRSFINM